MAHQLGPVHTVVFATLRTCHPLGCPLSEQYVSEKSSGKWTPRVLCTSVGSPSSRFGSHREWVQMRLGLEDEVTQESGQRNSLFGLLAQRSGATERIVPPTQQPWASRNQK